ncbi:MAG: ABC transporter transmembrane domain-containing protein, partial [Gaiellaceae bacterium]
MNVDPADLGFVATAVRLLRVWREQWRLVLLGFTCAVATTGFALAIPILIRHAIDNSIAPVEGPRDSLYPYLIAVLVLSVLRFGSNFVRRYATARVGIRVEARMRELLYQAYLRFPRAFYDQHATGQVVSRAT